MLLPSVIYEFLCIHRIVTESVVSLYVRFLGDYIKIETWIRKNFCNDKK